MATIVFVALVAPEAIVRDRRDGMFALYLSTPLSLRAQVVPEWAAPAAAVPSMEVRAKSATREFPTPALKEHFPSQAPVSLA